MFHVKHGGEDALCNVMFHVKHCRCIGDIMLDE